MKKLMLLFSMVLFMSQAFAQQSLEFGLNYGFSTYLGDLEAKEFTFNNSDFAIGVQGRYNFNSRITGRIAANYGRISGSDRTTGDGDLINRNLSFRSSILELSFIGEINILNFGAHQENSRNKKYYRWTPYVFGGVNLFRFNPQANYNNRWYDLQPLGTEGQGVPLSGKDRYSLTQIGIPLGLGVKYQLNPNIILSFEVGGRKTFTDYLDDVSGTYYNANEINIYNGALAADLAFRGDELANFNGVTPAAGTQRGDDTDDDWYLMNTFTISYKIFKAKNGGYKRNFKY